MAKSSSLVASSASPDVVSHNGHLLGVEATDGAFIRYVETGITLKMDNTIRVVLFIDKNQLMLKHHVQTTRASSESVSTTQ